MKFNQDKGYEPTERVLFNWGFHDGAFEQRRFGGESPIRATDWRRQNPVYTEGYDRGQAWQREGRYVEGKTLSTEAGNEFQAQGRGAMRESAATSATSPEDEYVDAVDEANAICDEWEREKQLKR